MMWQSLLKLRALPDDTRVYCGHEYTQANIRFAKTIEPDNKALAAREHEVDAAARRAASRRFPRRMGEEKAANPFLRADVPEVAKAVGLAGARRGKCSRKSASARTGPRVADELAPQAQRRHEHLIAASYAHFRP